MIELEILAADGSREHREFGVGEYTIGRVDSCDIVLAHGKVSRHHATLKVEASVVVLEDAGSANGTAVNGERIRSPRRLRSGDQIGIADFAMTVSFQEKDSTKPGIKTRKPKADKLLEQLSKQFDQPLDETIGPESKALVPIVKPKPPAVAPAERTEAPEKALEKKPPEKKAVEKKAVEKKPAEQALVRVEPDSHGPLDERKQAELVEIRRTIHGRLLEYLDLRKLDFNKVSERDIRDQARNLIRDILHEMREEIPAWSNQAAISKEVLDEALGLGPLEDLLEDPEVTEIMVNSKEQIFYERHGKLLLSDKRFTSNESLMGVIERIVAPLGRRIDESSPMVDARLKDGSRVNAIIPPLALKGPALTIRKFAEDPFQVEDLINFGSLTEDMALFLKACVAGRKNVVVSGGTGSGKTTLLNVLSSFIPANERIITIEDAAELQLSQPHVVSLESRPPNIEGKGAIAIRDLVKNSLRMRPDRIVVGECRGAEALDMLQAMNTGHDGSLTTGHANSPRDILSRLETMVLMGGIDLPIQAIRDQIAAAVDIIVQQARFSDGTRKITYITEILGLDDEHRYQLKNIFLYQQAGINPITGKVQGHFGATGEKPTFLAELQARSIPLDPSIFEPSHLLKL